MSLIEQSFKSLDAFSEHPFIKACLFTDYRLISEKIHLARTNNENELSFTKADQYCFNCGTQLAHIMSDIESLHHSLLYLSSFEPTQRMRKHFITKEAYTQYISNHYKIIFVSIYDKSLQIVNYVSALGLKKDNVCHRTVVKHLHMDSIITKNLQEMKEKSDRYRYERNSLVHRDAVNDIDLAKLTIQSNPGDVSQYLSFPLLNTNTTTDEYISNKIMEYHNSNQTLWRTVSGLFDLLLPVYQVKKMEMQ